MKETPFIAELPYGLYFKIQFMFQSATALKFKEIQSISQHAIKYVDFEIKCLVYIWTLSIEM